MVVDSKDTKEPQSKIPTLTKKRMNAVINELEIQRGIEPQKDTSINAYNQRKEIPDKPMRRIVDYETDSLERNVLKRNSSPTGKFLKVSVP